MADRHMKIQIQKKSLALYDHYTASRLHIGIQRNCRSFLVLFALFCFVVFIFHDLRVSYFEDIHIVKILLSLEPKNV